MSIPVKLYHYVHGSDPLPECADFREKFNCISSDDYSCPNCGQSSCDNPYIEDTHLDFPQFFNESIGSTLDGDYHDWDEVHCCSNCYTMFNITNGLY